MNLELRFAVLEKHDEERSLEVSKLGESVDEIKQKIDRIERRMEGIELRMEGIEQKLDQLIARESVMTLITVACRLNPPWSISKITPPR